MRIKNFYVAFDWMFYTLWYTVAIERDISLQAAKVIGGRNMTHLTTFCHNIFECPLCTDMSETQGMIYFAHQSRGRVILLA